jgi:hypothetical protein
VDEVEARLTRDVAETHLPQVGGQGDAGEEGENDAGEDARGAYRVRPR